MIIGKIERRLLSSSLEGIMIGSLILVLPNHRYWFTEESYLWVFPIAHHGFWSAGWLFWGYFLLIGSIALLIGVLIKISANFLSTN